MVDFPANCSAKTERFLQSAVVATQSPFSYAGQVQDWGGERWAYTIGVKARGRLFEAFASQTLNKRRPFIFRDPTIANAAHSTITVNGAGQSGNSLITAGWTVVGLVAGDFFSLGTGDETRLYQLTADVVPSSGAATLDFVPALRTAPEHGATVEIAAPAVRLRAVSPVITGVEFGLLRFTVEAVEAL